MRARLGDMSIHSGSPNQQHAAPGLKLAIQSSVPVVLPPNARSMGHTSPGPVGTGRLGTSRPGCSRPGRVPRLHNHFRVEVRALLNTGWMRLCWPVWCNSLDPILTFRDGLYDVTGVCVATNRTAHPELDVRWALRSDCGTTLRS